MTAEGPADLPQVGRSLPIRNVPVGECTYRCLYCCVGGTDRLRTRRRAFRSAHRVVEAVRERLRLWGGAEAPEFLTFLHGGEPTLDSALGVEILRLASTRVPVAVMTNASLVWRPDVREELLAADRVVAKIDTVDAAVWKRLNRPGPQLRLHRILTGLEAFRADFAGRLDTETVLLPGFNDAPERLRALAAFLEALAPTRMHVVVKGGAGRDPRRTALRTAALARDAFGALPLRFVEPEP